MRYKIELHVEKFFDPQSLDCVFTRAITNRLNGKGRVSISIPEYQEYDSEKESLLKVEFGSKTLYFKYIRISIMLYDLEFGIKQILKFLEEMDLLFCSTLKILPPPEYYEKK